MFWQQARDFYNVSQKLPITSKPLTAYYACMNATKALLSIHNINMTNISHGVSSARSEVSHNLAKNNIIYTGGGVLNHLSILLNEDSNKMEYNLQDILYNIPCIHRAFSLTYKMTELFIPVFNISFETCNHNKAYIRFCIDNHYVNGNSLKYINHIFEKTYDDKYPDFVYYRCKNRFKWNIHSPIRNRLIELNNYHRKIRKHFYYVLGPQKLWYIKKSLINNKHIIERSSLTLIYAAMHWLSEMVRYNPSVFNKLLSSRQNWLIKEFVDICLPQFIDEISCEITGSEIMCPGYRK